MPSVPTKEQERANRRVQLELAIDHRLGREFPREKRNALWEIMEDVEKRRLRLAMKWFVTKIFSRGRGHPIREADGLAGFMVEEFSRVLDDDELESFFDLRGETPHLPLDVEHEGR